jgi:hypothetical protein
VLWIGAAVAVVAIGFAVYHFAFAGGSGSEAGQEEGKPTSVIGSGKQAVGVSASGEILLHRPPPPEGSVPQLPLDRPPKSGHLAGPMLQQARVLGAAPAVLRSCVEASHYSETGVVVDLASGIELRFGGAARAAQKWAAGVAILADPTITEIGYVNLYSPSRASTGGSGATLPPPEPGGGTSCGG